MKLLVVLFAFVAVQASARILIEPDYTEDVLDLIDSADLSELFTDLPHNIFDEFAGGNSAANAEKCLPYVKPAYAAAVEVRGLMGKARELGKKLKEGAQKCKAQTKPEDKKKCFQELKKQAIAEGKPLKDAYLKVRPTIIDLMAKFDKCMGGQTEEAVDPMDAQQCLPYVQEAYDTAVEMRKIINKARELGKKLYEGMKKCKAMTKPDDKKKCFQELKKQAIAEGKPLKDSYMKIRPKIGEVMGKFDKCMAL